MDFPDPGLMDARHRAMHALANGRAGSRSASRDLAIRVMGDAGTAALHMRWYRGRSPAGAPLLISWLNLCPLEVRLEPEAADGSAAIGFTVHGHFEGTSASVSSAVQDAILGAVERGNERSDSRWLRGAAAKRGFFGHHGVNPKLDPYLTVDELMAPDYRITPEAPPGGLPFRRDPEAGLGEDDWIYNDGDVRAMVTIEDKTLTFHEFGARSGKRQGSGRRALAAMRGTFDHIVANGVLHPYYGDSDPGEALGFWTAMLREGLIDGFVLMQCGTEIRREDIGKPVETCFGTITVLPDGGHDFVMGRAPGR